MMHHHEASMLVTGQPFCELVESALNNHYSPTLIPCWGRSKNGQKLNEATLVLADAFDAEMERQGFKLRCWRGSPKAGS
jgi:hypothetical protein